MIAKLCLSLVRGLGTFILLSFALRDFGQSRLQQEVAQIAVGMKGQVGVCALHIETGETVAWKGEHRFPMQSVYKFPIAMAILHQVDAGRLSLGQRVRVDRAEYVSDNGHSPIRDKFPAGTELTVRELLRYNVAESDGTACDVLLRLLGGTKVAEQYVHQLGVADLAIATTEMIQVAHDTIQYRNWATPRAMAQLFKVFHADRPLSTQSRALLAEDLSVSGPWFDRRLKGLLPPGTPVIHKTGFG